MTARDDRRDDMSNLRVHAASLMTAAAQAHEARELLGREENEVRALLDTLAGLLAFTAGTLDYHADRQARSLDGGRSR